MLVQKLSESFSVSTLVSDLVIDKREYRNFPITVSEKVISANLVKLEMVYFDVLIGMDGLQSSYA